jgi:hypothetical protein
VREAAISFGANKWYLLTRVDLPLASPSIRAGINQTIMLSLAMVVVASLIGAKGLGEDVLEALQYANVGQGILAGFAILFCAMILDRIVQGAAQMIPLVLVHGFMGGSAQWQGQIAAFSGTGRHYAVTCRASAQTTICRPCHPALPNGFVPNSVRRGSSDTICWAIRWAA